MELSIDSILTSIIFFNIFILIISLARKNNEFIKNFSIYPIFLFSVLTVIRGLFSVDTKVNISINSKRILAGLFEVLRYPLFDAKFDIRVQEVLIFAWIVGSLYFLIKNIRNYMAIKKYLELIPLKESFEYKEIVKNFLEEKNSNENVDVFVSDKIRVPFMVGVMSGKIYLPDMNFSEKEVKYILSHETNHFLHYDNLKKYFIEALKIIFWWNPLIHSFSKDFENILEIQSDLNSTKDLNREEKIEYLNTITKVIKNNLDEEENKLGSLVYSYFTRTGDEEYLKQRFLIVLQYKKEKINKSLSKVLSSLAVIVFLLSYFVVFKPKYLPEEKGVYTAEEISEIYGEEIEEDENFLLKRNDGKYEVYINSRRKKVIKTIDAKYKDFPIYDYNEG